MTMYDIKIKQSQLFQSCEGDNLSRNLILKNGREPLRGWFAASVKQKTDCIEYLCFKQYIYFLIL